MLSSIFEGGLLLLVLLSISFFSLKKKTRFPGLLVGIFFVWYSIVRFLLEYRRTDSQLEFVGLLTKSQWFFLLFASFGLIFLCLRKRLFATKQ